MPLKKLFACLFVLFLGAEIVFSYSFTGRVSDVEQKCVLNVRRRKKIEKIIPYGIVCSKTANQELAKLTGKDVEVSIRDISIGGVKLADVSLSGKNISIDLVERGKAKPSVKNDIKLETARLSANEKGLIKKDREEAAAKAADIKTDEIKVKAENVWEKIKMWGKDVFKKVSDFVENVEKKQAEQNKK